MKFRRKITFVAILCIYFASFIGVAQAQETGANIQPKAEAAKATIGVMAHSDFVPDRVKQQAGQTIGLPDHLADRIIEHLANSRRLKVIERKALRRLVLEQRFGKKIQKTYLDRTLDKAIDSMENVDGGGVAVGNASGRPEGRLHAGAGAVGTTGTLSDYNDIVKDFQDMGAAVGADYLVLGDLEKVEKSTKKTKIPYSTQGREQQKNLTDSRLNLRIIDARNGLVTGAVKLRFKLQETLFEGRESDSDQYTLFDKLGRLTAAKILDVIFPARIVNLDPLVISRGINDGVKAGDVYVVEREGKELKDTNGIVIAKLRKDVGKVKVEDLQETVAIVKPISGEHPRVGDLAVLDVQVQSTQGRAQQADTGLNRSAKTPVTSSGLPRVAIGLVKSGSTAKTGNDAQDHTPIFTDTMISRLAQTKRFQMIDRQEVDQLLNEQTAAALAANQDLPSAMGSLKGADYLVYGSLASFGTEEKVTRLPNSTRSFKKTIGIAEGNMRIVNARTGDVIESRRISVKTKVDPTAKGSHKVTAIADAYAEQVTLMLMNAVYPIKVAHVGGDGSVYINRGDDGGLSKGESLDAFRPGAPIIDPDTGVHLGVEETPVGQVTVSEVEDARSKGTVTVGGPVKTGDLLKRVASNKGRRSDEVAKAQASRPVASGGHMIASDNGKRSGVPIEKATIAIGKLKLNPSAKTTALTKGTLTRLNDELAAKLLNTNRFVVMERQEVDQILDEKGFAAAAKGGDIQDYLSELQGADYLIHGEIINFYLDVKKKKVPFVDEAQVTVTEVAEGMFRIVDVHGGRVVAAEKVQVRSKVKNVKDANQLLSDLADRFTTRSVALLVERLYPIKVLGVAPDGIVYLNRGDDAGLKQGALFDVMRLGSELRDPDTGRSFGTAETKVSTVELVAVEANRSRAQFVEGGNARQGDILRKSQIEREQPKPAVVQPAW